jgi:hypothetical protein
MGGWADGQMGSGSEGPGVGHGWSGRPPGGAGPGPRARMSQQTGRALFGSAGWTLCGVPGAPSRERLAPVSRLRGAAAVARLNPERRMTWFRGLIRNGEDTLLNRKTGARRSREGAPRIPGGALTEPLTR